MVSFSLSRIRKDVQNVIQQASAMPKDAHHPQSAYKDLVDLATKVLTELDKDDFDLDLFRKRYMDYVELKGRLS